LPTTEAGAEATEEQINAARTNYSEDDTLIPALELRWTRKIYPLNVLIADRTVFVMTMRGSTPTVIALAGRSGRTLWSRAVPGDQSRPAMSYEGGRLFTVNFRGHVMALDGASGRLLWQRTAVGDGMRPRIATIQGLLVLSNEENVYALSLADGSLRWRTEVTREILSRGPTVDAGRVFPSCEVALRLAGGERLWRNGSSGSCGEIVRARDGVLVGSSGNLFSATSGDEAGRLTEGPAAIAPGVAIFTSPLRAQTWPPPGRFLWQLGDSGCFSEGCTPVVAGKDIYRVREPRLQVFDLATGRLRHSVAVPLARGDAGTPVVGNGLAVVPEEDSIRKRGALHAYSSILDPPPQGLQENTFEGEIELGSRVRLWGALGRALRRAGPANVTLQADAFPYRRFRSVKTVRTFADGGYGFKARPRINTRYRSATGSRRSAGGTVYVYPAFRVRNRRGRGRQFNRIRLSVVVRTHPRVRLGGRRFNVYVVRVRKRTVTRLTRGRLRRAGRGRARGRARYNAIRGLRRGDYLFLCVRGTSRLGMGARGLIDRRCGARRLPY
jgi:hypothetical protein